MGLGSVGVGGAGAGTWQLQGWEPEPPAAGPIPASTLYIASASASCAPVCPGKDCPAPTRATTAVRFPVAVTFAVHVSPSELQIVAAVPTMCVCCVCVWRAGWWQWWCGGCGGGVVAVWWRCGGGVVAV